MDFPRFEFHAGKTHMAYSNNFDNGPDVFRYTAIGLAGARLPVGWTSDRRDVFMDVERTDRREEMYGDRMKLILRDDAGETLSPNDVIVLYDTVRIAMENFTIKRALAIEGKLDIEPLALSATCGNCKINKRLTEFVEDRPPPSKTRRGPVRRFTYCLQCKAKNPDLEDGSNSKNHPRLTSRHLNGKIWPELGGAERADYLMQYYVLNWINPLHMQNFDAALPLREILRQRADCVEGEIWPSLYRQAEKLDHKLKYHDGHILVGQSKAGQDRWLFVQPTDAIYVLASATGPVNPDLGVDDIYTLDPFIRRFLLDEDEIGSFRDPWMGNFAREFLAHGIGITEAWRTCTTYRKQQVMVHVYIEMHSRPPILQPMQSPLRMILAKTHPSEDMAIDTWVFWPPDCRYIRFRIDDPEWSKIRVPGLLGLADDMHEEVLGAYCADYIRKAELRVPAAERTYFQNFGESLSTNSILRGKQLDIDDGTVDEVREAITRLRNLRARHQNAALDKMRDTDRPARLLRTIDLWTEVLDLAYLEMIRILPLRS